MSGDAEARDEGREDGVPSVIRADVLPCRANAGKADAVRDMLRRWRAVAASIAAAQWRLFHERGAFDPIHDTAADHRKAGAAVRSELLGRIAVRHGLGEDPSTENAERTKAKRRRPGMIPGFADPFTAEKALLGAAQFQMVRRQVVGMLRSFVSNRANDFVAAVQGSSLDEATKHMLFAVNAAGAWFDRSRTITVASTKGGPRDTVVPPEVRRLARKVMSHVMSLHRRPSVERIGMTVDRRIATLETADKSKAFGHWLALTVDKGRVVRLPLVGTPPFMARKGDRSRSFTIQADPEAGSLRVVVTTDVGATCAAKREAYLAATKCETLKLDFGLSVLFASDQGDLVGRGFLDKLRRLDATLTGIARHVARSGKRLRDSARYRKHAARTRGLVRTEINRALNRLVAVRRPETLVLERLDFRNPGLSRRMNRILSNCGRSVVKAKLAALEQELGVRHELAPAAYTSQTCRCGYVDPANRRSRSLFECRWCGLKMHADVMASKNLGTERFRPPAGSFGKAARDAVLASLVTGHRERWPMERLNALHWRPRGRGAPSDPRVANPYFAGKRPEARSGDAGGGASRRNAQDGERGLNGRATRNTR